MVSNTVDPKEILREPLPLRFTDRLVLQEMFLGWARENRASHDPVNVIAWLDSRRMLDRHVIRHVLSTDAHEHHERHP